MKRIPNVLTDNKRLFRLFVHEEVAKRIPNVHLQIISGYSECPLEYIT